MEPKRILVVDDNEAIHYDFRKALEINKKNNGALDELRSKVFSDSSLSSVYTSFPSFIIDSAYQGLEAIELLKKSIEKQEHYALEPIRKRSFLLVSPILRKWTPNNNSRNGAKILRK